MPADRGRHDVGEHGARLREAAGAHQAADRGPAGRHSIEATFGAAMPIEKRLGIEGADSPMPSIRWCARHPETGEKDLFVNAFTTHFTNFHTPDNVRYGKDYAPGAQHLLQYLISQAQIPEYQVRWRWKPEQRRHLGQPQHPALRRDGLPAVPSKDGTGRDHRRRPLLTSIRSTRPIASTPRPLQRTP
jgi:hypothetical protein